jgi:hypothetical protein
VEAFSLPQGLPASARLLLLLISVPVTLYAKPKFLNEGWRNLLAETLKEELRELLIGYSYNLFFLKRTT